MWCFWPEVLMKNCGVLPKIVESFPKRGHESLALNQRSLKIEKLMSPIVKTVKRSGENKNNERCYNKRDYSLFIQVYEWQDDCWNDIGKEGKLIINQFLMLHITQFPSRAGQKSWILSAIFVKIGGSWIKMRFQKRQHLKPIALLAVESIEFPIQVRVP